MGILSDFLRVLSRTKNGQKSCFAPCLPHENIWKLTLHGTHCAHTSMNLRRNEIYLLYLQFVFTLFLLIICEVLIKIWQHIWQRKVIHRRVWWIRSAAISRHDVSQTLRRPVHFFIHLWWRLRVISREWVSFIGVWTSMFQNRFI